MDPQQEQARSYAAAGMQALQTANGPAANEAFTKAINLGWPGADVWIALSHAKALLEDHESRIKALQNALQIDPSNLRARLYLGNAYTALNDRASAEAAFRQALHQSRAFVAQTPEVDQLLAAARQYLGASESEYENLVDSLARKLKVGSQPGDERFQQSLDILLGRKQPGPSKSQPTKYFYPGLADRQFFPLDEFDWTDALASRTAEIRAELEALLAGPQPDAAGFSPYVQATGREGAGASHPLLNDPSWSAFYLVKQGQRIDENIARCPKTMAAIDAIGEDATPAPAHSVLFSLLKPGASIPPHHGQFNTRLICHLPLILPGNCGFRVGNDTREWTDGEVFIFDDTIEHEAWNKSDKPRYVLIFEIWHPELDARQRDLTSELFALGKYASE